MSENEFILTMYDTYLQEKNKNDIIKASNPNNFIYCVCF